MEPIHPAGLEVDTPDQRRGNRDRQDRPGSQEALPSGRPAGPDGTVPAALPVGPAELLSEAELLREAEVLFRANEVERLRGTDAADPNEATSDPTGNDAGLTEEKAQAEQTRLANLVRDIEHTRLGELAYLTEQARLAAEAAGLPATSVSVLL